MAERITTAQSLNLAHLISGQSLTQDEIVERSGMVKPRIARWIKNNRDNIAITGWVGDKNGRLFVPQWRWTDAEDVPRPGSKATGAERVAAWRARQKLKGEMK